MVSLRYNDLVEIHDFFANEKILGKLEEFIEVNKKYPWLINVIENMSEYDLIVFEDKLKHLKDMKDQKNMLGLLMQKKMQLLLQQEMVFH
jgi:hypothetical protein